MDKKLHDFNSKILGGIFTDIAAYGLLLGGLLGGLYGTILAPLIGTLYGGVIGSIVGLLSGICAGLVVIMILLIHSHRYRLPNYHVLCVSLSILLTFLAGIASFSFARRFILGFNELANTTLFFIVIPSLIASLISGLVTV
jgi:chromate transport protein ChrA